MLVPFCFSGSMRNAGFKDHILLKLGRLTAVRVSGDSMRPTLADGNTVLVEETQEIAVGDIVLADHPFKASVTLLKRVASIDGDGRFELRGDDPDESSDSRSFGTLPLRAIRGKVVCRLARR